MVCDITDEHFRKTFLKQLQPTQSLVERLSFNPILHRCQPSRFRQDGPEFDCYVPLSRFTNLLSDFLSSTQQVQCNN